MEKLSLYNENVFESIKHIDERGNEYWLARELQLVLEYKEWRNFEKIINKAKNACKNSGYDIMYQFVDANKLIVHAKGAKRNINDYKLSRYACYLIVQNANPKIKAVALAQNYLATKTREQELLGINELATNLFIITQAEQKIKRENIQGENNINTVHYNMGKDIREFIKQQGGTVPEDLPTPEKRKEIINNE